MPFYERGNVSIHYEEAGSGFPLLVIPGGGLNSTVEGLKTHPFNPFDEFASEFRVIAPICAMPSAASRLGRWRPAERGTPTPTTIPA